MSYYPNKIFHANELGQVEFLACDNIALLGTDVYSALSKQENAEYCMCLISSILINNFHRCT